MLLGVKKPMKTTEGYCFVFTCMIHASEIFGDDDCGLILGAKDFPNLLLYEDGLPAALPACAGHGRQAAQAGAALLLLELWRRRWKRAGSRGRVAGQAEGPATSSTI